MRKNFVLAIFFICNIYNFNAQGAKKVSQTQLLHDVSKAQKLIDAKKYDEGLALILKIRKDVENGGENQQILIPFYYGRAIDLECEIYKNKGELDKMLFFIPNILNTYLKIFNKEDQSNSLVLQLINALRRFRSHKNYSKTLDSYLFLKSKLTEKSKYITFYVDNEINYLKKKNGLKESKTTISNSNTNKERDSIRKLILGNYGDAYSDDEPIDISESLGEIMGEAAKYQKILLGVFGLEAGFEAKDIKISDFNINQKLIDSLKTEGLLDNEVTESGFSIDDLKPAFEIPKRFDSILPNKILRETEKSIKKLGDNGKQNSLIYKMEKLSLIVANLLNNSDSDTMLSHVEALKNDLKDFSVEDSEYGGAEAEETIAEGLFSVHLIRGDYEKALEQALKMASSEPHDDKLNWFFMISALYANMKDFVNAEIWSKKVIEFNEPTKNENSEEEDENTFKKMAYPLYVNALVANKKYEEAIEASKQLEDLFKSDSDYIQENNPFFMMANFPKTIALTELKQYKEADLLMAKQIKTVNETRLDSILFPSLPGNETDIKNPHSLINILSQRSDYVFYYLSQRSVNTDSLTTMGYNSALIYKELLLNTEKTIQENIVSNNTDPETKVMYDKWIKTRELASDVNFKNRDSVLDYARFYKKKLMESGYGDLIGYMKNAKLNWKRIKNNLSKNEAAIEFIRFSPYAFEENYQDKLYGVFLITCNLKYPKFINLFNEKALNKYLKPFTETNSDTSILVNELYNNHGDELYNLIWKPMEKDLSSIETIYYSPTGLLHSLALSALSDASSDYQLLGDKYRLVQVSSTKNIVDKKPVNRFNSACLYGGLTYQLDESVEKAVNKFLETKDESRGGNWSPLDGTKIEVEEINKIFKSKNIRTILRKEAYGLEETLYKDIKEGKPNILHIATHAFYESPFKKRKPEDLLGLASLKSETDNLNKSGLVLSGANYFWKHGEKKNSKVEDGILTANEIASLDLRDTELVTLSACETGIGNSINNEGVFGIQRGLKMAGAKTLLLSLWKVDDVVTKEYMVLFYDYLINQDYQIQEAYNKTQEIIREKYPEEPFKWAAFVLIKN